MDSLTHSNPITHSRYGSVTVGAIAERLALQTTIVRAIKHAALTRRVFNTPFRWNGRPTNRLGSFSPRLGMEIHPVLLEDPTELRDTFLHEVAHAIVHYMGVHESAHGPEWRAWARSLGCQVSARGQSAVLAQHTRERLKPIARCVRCGHVIRRLRRLPKSQRYVHAGSCGGELRPL